MAGSGTAMGRAPAASVPGLTGAFIMSSEMSMAGPVGDTELLDRHVVDRTAPVVHARGVERVEAGGNGAGEPGCQGVPEWRQELHLRLTRPVEASWRVAARRAGGQRFPPRPGWRSGARPKRGKPRKRR